MNTKKEYSYDVIKKLSDEGVKINVTAAFTLGQVEEINNALTNSPGAVVSIFAGRIADTGRDPIPLMIDAKNIIANNSRIELLWASPRELLNIIQADEIGCDIITATPDILKKLNSLDKDLEQFSMETVQMFHRDAQMANFSI